MGWIRELKAVPGEGIYGRVEWTEPGANYVRSKQYRFLSPAGWIRKSDLRLVSIKSVALVNQPGIVGMRPIVNSAARGTGDRARAIAKAGAEFDANKERLSRISSGKEAYVNGSLLAAGQARLTRGEAAGLVAAEPGRSAVIANAAAEWEANKNGSLRLCGKDAWVNGALRQAGHTLLNKWEAVACKGGRDLHGYEVRLSINSDAAQSGRDNVIEKAVDDWKADKALQGVIDMEAFVQDALDQANLGKMTRQDRRTMAIVSNIAAKGIAESAGKTWDGDQAIQRLMTRDEYIDAALQEGGIDDVSKT